jgi:UDP-glucose 4-epimerase
LAEPTNAGIHNISVHNIDGEKRYIRLWPEIQPSPAKGFVFLEQEVVAISVESKPRILVTGAAGFIGSNLCEKLLDLGYPVVGIDNFSTGRQENIETILSNKNFQFFELDIRNREKLQELKTDIEYIFHLAALADIVPSIINPVEYMQVNVQGTINILEFARSQNIRKFIYTASSSCYGIPVNFPTNESEKIDPCYPYALSKYIGEISVLHWSKVYGFKSNSLRLFNVYGPRGRTSGTYGAVFGVFLAQKINQKPLTIVGDGNQTRDFTHVSDVVRAFILVAFSETSYSIYNVGSGGTYSIGHLANLIDPMGRHEYIPKRPGEPDCTFADISRIQNDLGWSPEVSFESGVTNMLSNLQYWSKAPVWDKDSIKVATSDWFKYLGRNQ